MTLVMVMMIMIIITKVYDDMTVLIMEIMKIL